VDLIFAWRTIFAKEQWVMRYQRFSVTSIQMVNDIKKAVEKILSSQDQKA